MPEKMKDVAFLQKCDLVWVDGQPVYLNNAYERRVKKESLLRAGRTYDDSQSTTSVDLTNAAASLRRTASKSRLTRLRSSFGVRKKGRAADKNKLPNFIRHAQDVGVKAIAIPAVVIFDMVGSIIGR